MVEATKKIQELVRTNFLLKSEFIIWGAPARKSNSRIYTGTHFLLGASAQAYTNIFEKQIVRLKKSIQYPIDDRDCVWIFNIWYSDTRSDASVELIFDLLQNTGIITNDVNIRNYIVLSEELDKELPRTEIKIYKLKGA